MTNANRPVADLSQILFQDRYVVSNFHNRHTNGSGSTLIHKDPAWDRVMKEQIVGLVAPQLVLLYNLFNNHLDHILRHLVRRRIVETGSQQCTAACHQYHQTLARTVTLLATYP